MIRLWENPEVPQFNKLPGRSSFESFPTAALAKTRRRNPLGSTKRTLIPIVWWRALHPSLRDLLRLRRRSGWGGIRTLVTFR